MSTPSKTSQTIIVGGGCFWCLDTVYRRVDGVESVVTGYSGGHVASPTFNKVASKLTGHAEVVKVTFDPAVIDLSDILDIFWAMHDPTSKDRQMYDVGPEYRSIILYNSPSQKKLIEASLARAQKLWSDPIVTEIAPLDVFYEAEKEHQDFYSSGQRPDYCQLIINPKLAKLREKFTKHLKKEA